jgi:hypothetical protein
MVLQTAVTTVLVLGMVVTICAPLAWTLLMEPLRLAKLSAVLRPVVGGSVLDVGCNDGILSATLLQRQREQQQQEPGQEPENHPPYPYPNITSIYGIDPHLPDGGTVLIPAQKYDGETIPASDHQYDVAMANFILHHAGREGTQQILKEMKRVSRRHIVILEDYVDTTLALGSTILTHELARLISMFGMQYTMDGFRTKTEWFDTFTECGLRVVAVQDYSSTIFMFPFLRHTLYILEDDNENNTKDNGNSPLPPVNELMLYRPGWRDDPLALIHGSIGVVLTAVIFFYLILVSRRRSPHRHNNKNKND